MTPIQKGKEKIAIQHYSVAKIKNESDKLHAWEAKMARSPILEIYQLTDTL
jgi:hypothetical protein